MHRLAAATFILGAMVSTLVGQTKPLPDQKSDVKRCAPKIVNQAPSPKEQSLRTRTGEKSTGFSPIVAFQILESGEVVHAYVKRSSGIADIDAYALKLIQRTKFNRRSGCGIIESESSVDIDFI